MKKMRTVLVCLLLVVMLCMTSVASAASYNSYRTAYNAVTAQGCMDANINAEVTMAGTSLTASGNMKIDFASDIMYYTINVNTADGVSKVEQFTDGTFLYVNSEDGKIKYDLTGASSSEDAQQVQGDREMPESAPIFNVDAFLGEFAQCLDAGKIADMGLLSAIPQISVTSLTEKDGVYELTVAKQVLRTLANNMIQDNSNAPGDTLTVDEISDFAYTAKVVDNIVTSVTYIGTIHVTVPASLMGSGVQQEYDLQFNITMNFNNPGTKLEFQLPDVSEYVLK